MAKRPNYDEIDEEMLIASISQNNETKTAITKNETANATITSAVESVNTENQAPETERSKETSKRKRKESVDYSSAFLRHNEMQTRQCVYISREIHSKISRIVNVVADKNVTVGGYIDNVLRQHLDMHKDEINELYRRERENLI